MSRILFVQRVPLRRFYWRRASRILPGLWVYLLVAYGAGFLVNGSFDANDALCTIAFVRSYCVDVPLRSEVANAHMWSLAVEEHSYVALSLLALMYPAARDAALRRTLLILLAVPLFAVVLYKYLMPGVGGHQFYVRSEVAAFPLFASVAIYMQMQGRMKPKWSGWLSPTCFALGILSAAAIGSPVASLFICSVLLAISIHTLRAGSWFVHLLENRMLRWFGVYSYSIYLWQQLLYWYKFPISWLPAGSQLVHLVYAGLSIAVGALSYKLIESPARVALNRFGASRGW